MQITLTAKDLGRLLRPVLPHADKGGTLPLLESVYVASEPGRLVAAATDRYTLGIQRVKVEGVEPGLRALLPADAVKTLLKMFRATRAYNPDLTLTFDGVKATVESTGLWTDGLSEAKAVFHLQSGEYPIDSLLRLVKAERKPSDSAALNPAFLARFAHAQTQGEPLVLHLGGDKPTRLTVGDDFIGFIMPVRFAGAPDAEASWDSTLAAALAVPEPVKTKRTRKAEQVPA